jgi:hypothetical protein
MGSMRQRLKRLERRSEIAIPQRDGTVKRFPESALAEAYLNLMDRWRSGAMGGDTPPEHPLLEAARNSSDPTWAQSVWASDPEPLEPIPNMFEGG